MTRRIWIRRNLNMMMLSLICQASVCETRCEQLEIESLLWKQLGNCLQKCYDEIRVGTCSKIYYSRDIELARELIKKDI